MAKPFKVLEQQPPPFSRLPLARPVNPSDRAGGAVQKFPKVRDGEAPLEWPAAGPTNDANKSPAKLG